MKEERLYMIFTFCNVPKIKEVINYGLAKVFAFFGHSSLVHFAIEAYLSEINDLIIIPDPRTKVNAFWNARNSIAVLLPA